MFKAHFAQRKDVSNAQVLEQIIKDVDLDENEAMPRLYDDTFRKRILEKEAYWQQQGVSAVPTIVFNDDIVMNGAYPVGTYKQVLCELLEKKFNLKDKK